MEGTSMLADILQTVGYSELIENFDGEEYHNVEDFLTNAERMKAIVPETQLNDFMIQIHEFFSNKNTNSSDDEDSSSDDYVGNTVEDRNKENLMDNNIVEDKNDEILNNDIDGLVQPIRNNNVLFAIESVDIRAILNSSFEGRQILDWHKTKSILTTGQRRRLVYLIVSSVMSICDRALIANDFKVLSRKIVEVFKSECALVYYEPSVSRKKSNTGRTKKAKGKLLHKYNNLKKLAVLLSSKPKSPEKVQCAIEINEDVENSINWLKNQEEPWEETEQHWIATAGYRQTQVETQLINKVSSIFQEWPILRTPKGYNLIAIDFALRKFTEISDAINGFGEFFSKASHVRPLRKDEHNDLLQSMLLKDDLKEDDRTLIRLMLLCLMLPSTARISVGGKKKWKPSVVESLEGIVARVKVIADIELVKTTRHAAAANKHLTVQPYVIVVEEYDYHVSSAYLCIDDVVYNMPSVLKALDLCFKAFHVFNAQYTIQSKQIWLMLQLGLYQFRTKWDESITDVNAILNDMNCLPRPADNQT